MRIVVSEFVSLDGVMEDPGGAEGYEHGGWTMQYGSADMYRVKLEELMDADALLLGRVTYEGFAAAWPGRTDEAGFAERMNSLPKYVVTSVRAELEWNARSIGVDELEQVKEEPGRDVLVAGSAMLVNELLRRGLVDELKLLVFPVVLGKGKRLFRDGLPRMDLKLAEARSFDTGVALVTYRRT